MSYNIEKVKADLKQEILMVESYLKESLKDNNIPAGLKDAMYYSLLAGGKRIRPVLCLLFAGLFGLNKKDILSFACAIECIHTYSLIHDDLPAMDDDDLRRGKPSCHKQFNEATAILAGDALLTDAFVFMSNTNTVDAKNLVLAIKEVALAAGSAGMVGGQFLDMDIVTRKDVSLEELAYVHSMKTGALLRASCVSGAILAGASSADLVNVLAYSKNIGAAFQIMDDVLDIIGDEKELGKPVGSDIDMGKITYPSLIGIDKSLDIAREKINTALSAIDSYKGYDAELLKGLAVYIVNRKG